MNKFWTIWMLKKIKRIITFQEIDSLFFDHRHLTILLLFMSTILFGQQKEECVAHTTLTIEPHVHFCGNIQSPVFFPELIYGVPCISPVPIHICYETNSPLSIMYLESPQRRGNLHNNNQEIQTFFLLTESQNPPTSLDPRWKRGEHLGQFLKKMDHSGKLSLNLYVRLFADSTCVFDFYQNVLNMIVIDNFGQKHIQSIGLQTRLDESSLIKRLRQEAYRPKLSQNVKDVNSSEFIITRDVLEVVLEPVQMSSSFLGHIPLQVYISHENLPCILTIETINSQNYFQNNKSQKKITSYQLTPSNFKSHELQKLLWVEGEGLNQLSQTLDRNGYYSWDLWILIQDGQKGIYENTVMFVLTDSRGKRQVQSMSLFLK